MAVRQSGQLVTTSWMDNKVVTVLSTDVQPGEIDTCKRKQKNGTYVQLSCPQAVVKYVKYMRGVDQKDQLRSHYLVRLKSRKFYKYVFWFLFELALTNAFVVYRAYSGGEKMKLREFRLELAKELIGDYNSRKRPRVMQPLASTAAPINFPKHYPTKKRAGSKKGVTKCKYCAANKRRRETYWYCETCQVHLCHTGEKDGTDCFSLYPKKIL